MNARGASTVAVATLLGVVALLAAAPAPVPSASPTSSPSASLPPVHTMAPRPLGSAAPEPLATMAPLGASATLTTTDYTVESDTFVTHDNGDFEAPHKLAFSRPGSDGTADSARGNRLRGTVTLIGNVVIHDNGNAPEATQSSDEYAKGGPATLTCDRLDIDTKAKTYVATGSVHFEQGTRKAFADRGALDRTSGLLHLEGHVRTYDGDAQLRGDVIDYNLTTKHYDATGRPVTILQPVPTPAPGSGSPTPAPKKRKLPF